VDVSWIDDAACRDADPDLWFSDVPIDQHHAIVVCSGCPVREPCLQEALDGFADDGIFGGLTAPARRNLRRRMRRTARA
jgi:WhiB family transcriptional regulator, redox-sensing transcriptional regulator